MCKNGRTRTTKKQALRGAREGFGGMEAGNMFFQWGGENDAYQLPA